MSRWLIGVMGGTAITFLLTFFYLARSGGSETGYIGGSEGSLVGETGLVVSELGPTGIVGWVRRIGPRPSIRETPYRRDGKFGWWASLAAGCSRWPGRRPTPEDAHVL